MGIGKRRRNAGKKAKMVVEMRSNDLAHTR
jgi:hypothetical protein